MFFPPGRDCSSEGAKYHQISFSRFFPNPFTGLASYCGFLLGMHEVARRGLENIFHEGAIIFVLMVICIVSSLLVYDWLCKFAIMCRDPGHSQVRATLLCRQIAGMQAFETYWAARL